MALCVGWLYSRAVEVDVVDGTDEGRSRLQKQQGGGRSAPIVAGAGGAGVTSKVTHTV